MVKDSVKFLIDTMLKSWESEEEKDCCSEASRDKNFVKLGETGKEKGQQCLFC